MQNQTNVAGASMHPIVHQPLPLDRIICGDNCEVMRTFPSESIDLVVTSPPYFGLRDYGNDKQIGLEEHPDDYIDRLTSVFAECFRLLKPFGSMWVNIGDSYNTNDSATRRANGGLAGYEQRRSGKVETHERAGGKRRNAIKDGFLKPKDLMGVPWRLAFALQAEGWYLRQDVICSKPSPMPESVVDRCVIQIVTHLFRNQFLCLFNQIVEHAAP